MQLHDFPTDTLDGPGSFLPFGQAGYIVNTENHKRKLDDRGIPANYVRVLSKDNYLVNRRDKKSITSVRQSELC